MVENLSVGVVSCAGCGDTREMLRRAWTVSGDVWRTDGVLTNVPYDVTFENLILRLCGGESLADVLDLVKARYGYIDFGDVMGSGFCVDPSSVRSVFGFRKQNTDLHEMAAMDIRRKRVDHTINFRVPNRRVFEVDLLKGNMPLTQIVGDMRNAGVADINMLICRPAGPARSLSAVGDTSNPNILRAHHAIYHEMYVDMLTALCGKGLLLAQLPTVLNCMRDKFVEGLASICPAFNFCTEQDGNRVKHDEVNYVMSAWAK